MTKDLQKSNVIAPMATAIWLIDNTSLSFKQIGDFCNFTEAEVQLIADGVIGNGVFAVDPTKNGNLTVEEIYQREQDGGELKNSFASLKGLDIIVQKKKKYIPMLQRRSRPEAILWLIAYCPELTDAQVIKLVRTTKSMVTSIRNKTYNEYNNLIAKDPVVLGFCTQKNLDKECQIAKEKTTKSQQENKKEKKIRTINVNQVKVKKTTKKQNNTSKTAIKDKKNKSTTQEKKTIKKEANNQKKQSKQQTSSKKSK